MSVKAIDGKPVMDAKSPVKIIVTRNDVTKADVKHPESCAAARAALRDLHAKEVRVHLGRVYVRFNESNWLRFETPKDLRAEIIAFDRGGAFEPGGFTLKPLHTGKRPTGKTQGGVRSRIRSRKLQKPRTILKNVRTGPA